MLIEDIQSGIFPRTSKNKDFKIKINSTIDNVNELLEYALPIRGRYSKNEPHEIVTDFVEEVMLHLAYHGQAQFEIVYYIDETTQMPTKFKLESIFHDNISSLFGFYWQILPKKIFGDRSDYPKKFVWLGNKDIFVVKIPKKLGGKRKYNQFLSNLCWLSKCHIPDWAMQGMAESNPNNIFDYAKYQYDLHVYLAKISKKYGWPARSLWTDRALEYYQIYRYLTFLKTKIILRDHIISETNKCLKKVGNKIGFEISISHEGLFSSQQIDGFIKQLKDGTLQFDKVVKIMSQEYENSK